MIAELALKDIRTDGGMQHRAINENTLICYTALIKEGCQFPPVSIIDDGANKWLWDGLHRLKAHQKLKKNTIKAQVEPGSKRDAMFFSFGANKEHGLPRQVGTAKVIIEKIMADEEWKSCTDEGIAGWIGVTRQHVSKIRSGFAESNMASSCHLGQAESTSGNQAEKEDSGQQTHTVCIRVFDSVGEEVPEEFELLFSRVREIKDQIHLLNKLLKQIKQAREDNDALYAYLSLADLESEIGNIKRNLRFTIPYAVCRYCSGDGKDCRACKGLGFQNEVGYKTTIEELKKKD